MLRALLGRTAAAGIGPGVGWVRGRLARSAAASAARALSAAAPAAPDAAPPPRPPLPPFTEASALVKIQAAEDAWNSRDPYRVVQAYTPDSRWRNRAEHLHGHEAIIAFLKRKWAKEHQYRLKKSLWCTAGNRIAVRFEYEWVDDEGQWWRSHGNENWEFAPCGRMSERHASINDEPIKEDERRVK